MRFANRIASTGIFAGILTALLASPPTASATAAVETHTAMVCLRPTSSHAMQAMGTRYACGLHHLRGQELETTFMAAMIPHHVAAVAMARLELARGTHPQPKAMGRLIIARQNPQNGQMTNRLHACYGLNPPPARARAPPRIRRSVRHVGGH